MLHKKHTNPHLSSPQSLFLSQFSSPDKGRLGGVIAFTLVELIVVVTILAILATIWFVSYSSYLIWVRDTNRIAQMTKMSDGLNLYSTRNALPIPEDYVEVQINGSLIWYQWYAGSSVLETIEYEKGGVDPKDNTYFTYYLTKDRKYFQLLWFLEEWSDLTTDSSPSMRGMPEKQGELSLVDRAYANTYSERIPTVLWKKLWVLTDDLNTPIQEIWSVTTAGLLDIWSTSDSYKAYLKDDDVIEGDSTDLVSINPSGSCLRIKQMKGSSKSGVYKINPDWNNAFEVYCDMETDGGGWTYATMLADSTTRNLFDTWNTKKITSITSDISSKWTISNIWNDDQNKDIMLVCKTTSENHKSYESPFIIYWYLKADIWNLERQTKQATPFATKSLKAKYRNKQFQLWTGYAWSSAATSHYIVDTWNLVFALASWTVMTVEPSWSSNWPTYTTWTNSSQPIDTTNYCMTAIR